MLDVMAQQRPRRKVVEVRIQRTLRVGYRVKKNMKKDDIRNMMAPMRRTSLKISGSVSLNLRMVRLSPARVPGRDALIIGSVRFP